MSYYTASFAFFEAIWEAGIRYCFVNLGSDHPSILEAIVRGQNEKRSQFPKIITCPNEMVAMSMADGYARLTGEPQCVIVHVDVGTQGLGAAVHNASSGRAPVLIFAGLSPFTIEGEHRGSRTEFIHWLQDVPDQKQIVAQYCRYSAEIRSGKNIKQMVNRALSFATSDPKGPVYLMGAREIMEAEIEPYTLNQAYWNPVAPAALPPSGVETIAQDLVQAREPLVITGYSGRNPAAVQQLVMLANTIKGLRVLDTGASDMCFPADHPSWLGFRYGVHENIGKADVIMVLDCDVPWINTQCKPSPNARIYHLDGDPLKQMMPTFYIDALARYKADSETALAQLNAFIAASPQMAAVISSSEYENRWQTLQAEHQQRIANIDSQAQPSADGYLSSAYLISRLRAACPADTIWCIEAVTHTGIVADQIKATLPGSWINCGAGGLGWSGGGTLGVKLASMHRGENRMVVQIVGDGTYLFSVPGSVYWIAQRYGIPILTIVLNNKGWHAPRKSLLLVHPDGEGSKATREDLNISFAPTPDYAGIAKAAAGGNLFAAQADTVAELDGVLQEAIQMVQGGVSAVVDARLEGPQVDFRESGRRLVSTKGS